MLDLFEIIKALMHRPHLLLPLGLGAGSTELQILNVIKKADEDQSGQVTKEELMNLSKTPWETNSVPMEEWLKIRQDASAKARLQQMGNAVVPLCATTAMRILANLQTPR